MIPILLTIYLGAWACGLSVLTITGLAIHALTPAPAPWKELF